MTSWLVIGIYFIALFLVLLWILGLVSKSFKYQNKMVLGFYPSEKLPYQIQINNVVVREDTPEKALFKAFSTIYPNLLIWEAFMVDEEDAGFNSWKQTSNK